MRAQRHGDERPVHPEVIAAGTGPHVSRVDGNALAGLLDSLSGLDPTTAVCECRACGLTAPLADSVVEADPAGTIVICRSCTHTLFSLVRTGGRLRLELGALSSVRM